MGIAEDRGALGRTSGLALLSMGGSASKTAGVDQTAKPSWDFRMEMSAKLKEELARAVADAQARPAQRQRELDAAQAEEARARAREEKEAIRLAELIETYKTKHSFRPERTPLECEVQREAFLTALAQ